ncbi:unnamed protein product [Trichobilharzia regenti]|nr:unnamed protein product [Trichobilharzia regenti]
MTKKIFYFMGNQLNCVKEKTVQQLILAIHRNHDVLLYLFHL